MPSPSSPSRRRPRTRRPPARSPWRRFRVAQKRAPLLGALTVLALTLIAVAVMAAGRPAGPRPAGAGSAAAGIEPAGGTPVNPSAFAVGACVAYPPTRGDNHHTVFLDAGHGGLDPGSVGVTESGHTIYEADETLPVELDAAALLRSAGFRVVVSRTDSGSGAVARLGPADVSGRLLTAAGVHADVAARAICANDAHAQALIGIYFDAGAPNNAGSVTGWDAARRFASANLRLATLVQDDTLAAMNAQGWQIPSEGVQLDSGLGSAISSAAETYGHLLELGPAKAGYFSTPSEMPGAVIEPLFITDPFEGSIANSTRGQRVIASGIATAVEQFFRVGRN